MENHNLKIIDLSKRIDEAMKRVAIERTANLKDNMHGLFTIKTANDWIEEAKKRPIPKMLFSQLWYEGEICILFSDTNLGKSILAVQIGNSISKGEQIKSFIIETQKQSVLYFDFELSDKQFQNRYSKDYKENYVFDDNFLRVEINPDLELPKDITFDDYLILSIEKSILSSNSKVLIIDNITYLKSDNEKAKEALPLMKKLKELKTKYSLSILILAHTPKRDLSKPITRNDLAGSKMLINFCDSCFTIGESTQDKQIRYIKQIKQRNCEQVFDADNVCVCQINKEYNFLQFEFVSLGNEREHLKQYTEKDKNNVILQVKELSQQGKSQRAISSEVGISLGAVNKYLKL
jgi:RecA-family ATPase